MFSKLVWLIVAWYATLHVAVALNQESAFDTANKKSVQALDSIPRWGGVDTLDPFNEDWSAAGYATGLVSVLAPFLILTLLSVLIWPFWCMCRWCHCCCCKKRRYTEEPSTVAKWLPFLFILCCCVLMVVFAGIAYDANQRFSAAVVDEEEGMLAIVSDLFDNLNSFVQGTLFDPLDTMESMMGTAIDNVTDVLGETDVIVSGTGSIVALLWNFSADYAAVNVTVESDKGREFTFMCEICTEVSDMVGETAETIETETDPIFEDLSTMIDSVTSTLVDVRDDVEQQISDVRDQISEVDTMLSDTEEDYEETYRPQAESVNGQREIAYNVLFAIPLVPIIFIVLGGLFRKSCFFTLAYSIMWLSFFIMFFMLTLHVPISLVLNDVCKLIDLNDDNMSAVMGDPQGKLVQSCLDNTSIAEAFDVEETLSFINIPFPNISTGELLDAFAFDGLDTFSSNLSGTTGSGTFGGIVDEGLEEINILVANCSCANDDHYYTRDNVSELDWFLYYNKTAYPVSISIAANWLALKNITELTVDMISAELNGSLQFEAIVIDMQARTAEITNATADLEVEVAIFVNKTELLKTLLDPIIAEATRVVNEGNCGFIGTAYRGMKARICDDVLAALATMVMCMFLIGIFSLLSCCASIKMVRKIKPLMDESAGKGGNQQVVVINSGQPQFGHAMYMKET